MKTKSNNSEIGHAEIINPMKIYSHPKEITEFKLIYKCNKKGNFSLNVSIEIQEGDGMFFNTIKICPDSNVISVIIFIVFAAILLLIILYFALISLRKQGENFRNK